MCSMCHNCGAELLKLEENKRQENGNSLKLHTGGSCKFCRKKQEGESIKWDGASQHEKPMISPTTSLSSSDSFVTNCSEYSVDVNSFDRINGQEITTDDGQESCRRMESNSKESSNGDDRHIARDVEIQTTNGQEAKDGVSGNLDQSSAEVTEKFHSIDDELDAEIWEPPEAEDPEDDMEGSMAYNDDDDDECGDGSNWSKPFTLSRFRDERSGSYKFKVEKQRAMEEVINGKFRALVCHLLKSVGVSSSGEDGESWADIVTSLSWEAASFLKPDTIDGKVMDPNGHVKVKCIATGSRGQSCLVKGLVFKKHAAHKHMPTKYENPKLLLISGVLGQSSSGLSSFASMAQEEKGYLKSLIDMIESCHPNVILVEKTVSRDIQESIRAKGMTLVSDMKHHRLERIARCTGAPILSADTLTCQKLKQFKSFYIEKFVEEHAPCGEGGKRPSKTLMFLEGCPTRLGCTILLKGSHSDELKRIKLVVQCAVIAAYHLILETSFLVDQRAMFSTIQFPEVENVLPTDRQSPNLGSGNSSVPCIGDCSTDGTCTVDIPISNGFHAENNHNSNLDSESNSPLAYEPYNPAIFTGFSSLSASLKKVVGESFPFVSSASYQSLSSYFGFNESNGHISKAASLLTTPEAVDDCDMEAKGSSDEEKSLDGGQVPLEIKIDGTNEDQMQSCDDVNTVMDSQSILVLMSRRNALRGTICEQSHFSHIMFYKNFDAPLGKFLKDNLLNQCATCGELPEAHFYHYAHHSKQLTIQVKRLLEGKHLPGEAEGKLWMWSHCGKCKPRNGTIKSTKRVLISNAARSLSFGKFLELNLSLSSSSSRLSSCGHSLQRDFLYFFGLGPMAAIFKYSTATIYNVSLPPQKLEFRNLVRQEWLKKETMNVYTKGMSMFTEVENSLKRIRSQFSGKPLNLQGVSLDLSDIEDMLKQERSEFEVNIQNAVFKNGNPDQTVYKLLSLNQLLLELLLESCIWDRRLHSLLSSDPAAGDSITAEKVRLKQVNSRTDGPAAGGNVGTETILENSNVGLIVNLDTVEGQAPESSDGGDLFNTSNVAEGEMPTVDLSRNIPSKDGCIAEQNGSAHCKSQSGDDNCQAMALPSFDHVQVDRSIPISAGVGNTDDVSELHGSKQDRSLQSAMSSLRKLSGWPWTPFSEIQPVDMKDILKGYLQKPESISSYTPDYIPTAYQLILEEGPRLHIPLESDNFIVSDYDGELSSVIACALASLEDLHVPLEALDEDRRRENGMVAKQFESLHSLPRVSLFPSPYWSSNGSSDSDSVSSTPSISLEDSRFSSFDGLNLLDSHIPPEPFNPVVNLQGKGKYSVACLYANEFRDLRHRCCPSEVDYIASLSRCRNWDAKGGKSKSFFAKTLDDRFIIKEIKKTELDSFMKFARDYFKYMNQSFELGNQTCLAKVLGIYQVNIRQARSGRENRHDLMVMENLNFGRKITRQYDLKGALHSRYTAAADGSGDVLLDQNFVNDMNSSPLYVSNKAKRFLQRAVWNDTAFLNSINVMDYSLLVAVDTERRELVCGIIDYLRQYTWDKQLETWVKSSLVPRNLLPTVISPKEYKRRFRKFMSSHFLCVPDHWCSELSSDPCELCGVKDD
ncbi:hypothetical protein I3843_15G005900 [Carya illinoinensis]|nr:hypothetical protein I3843_15G005900 [Carya illinoinensis]